MPETFLETAFAARLAERFALSAVIVLAAAVIMVGFWRGMSRVDFDLSRDKLGASANIALATPVFALLALVGFAWVSFSHPITLEAAPPPAAEAPGPTAQAPAPRALARAIGAAPGAPGAPPRAAALDHIAELNCLLAEADPRRRPALEAARLSLLLAVWDPAWGDAAAYARRRAAGEDTGMPVPDVHLEDRNPC